MPRLQDEICQTDRTLLLIRFQEHYRNFIHNNAKSKFVAHLLENHHSIGNINDIMDILYITKKGHTMDAIERYYIYNEPKKGTQINDKNTVKSNRIKKPYYKGRQTDSACAADPILIHHKFLPHRSTQQKSIQGRHNRYSDTRPQGTTQPDNVLHPPTSGLSQRPHHMVLIHPGYIYTSMPQDTMCHQ